MQPPIYYDYATVLENAVSPGAVKSVDNLTVRFYTDYLLKRAMSIYEWSGIPATWDKDFLQYGLFCYGKLAVIDVPGLGAVPQYCTLSGYNLYYRPRLALVANSTLPSRLTGAYLIGQPYNNGKDFHYKGYCELLYMQPNYKGLLDMIEFYAVKLAYLHSAEQMNAANSKFAYIFAAKDKNAAELFKAAVDSVQAGNFAVITGKGLWDENGKPLWDAFTNNLRENYIVSQLLEDERRVMNDFDSWIGIPAANYDKKAQMTDEEVTRNDVETQTLSDIMFDTLRGSIEEVNKHFGLSLRVEKRYRQEVNNNGDSKANPDRSV